jgi:hypothetical protein
MGEGGGVLVAVGLAVAVEVAVGGTGVEEAAVVAGGVAVTSATRVASAVHPASIRHRTANRPASQTALPLTTAGQRQNLALRFQVLFSRPFRRTTPPISSA